MDVHTVALPKRMVGTGLGVTLSWCRRQGLAHLGLGHIAELRLLAGALGLLLLSQTRPPVGAGFL